MLLFGSKLPSVARSLGKSVTEFKKGMSGLEEEFHSAGSSSSSPRPSTLVTTMSTIAKRPRPRSSSRPRPSAYAPASEPKHSDVV